MHNFPWLPLIILVLAGAVVAALKGKTTGRRDADLSKPWPLEAKNPLLSDPERVLYQRLVQALPDHIILAQVQLLQALQFKRGQRSQALLNRISQLSVDFLILNPDTSIRAAIELDDRSHERADRKQADARKTHALQSAGVPLIRWNTRSLPDIAAIGTAVGAVPVQQPGSRR